MFVSEAHPSLSEKEWQMLNSKGLRGFRIVDFPENTYKRGKKDGEKCTV
jgi:hypothetical protein